MSGLRFKAGDLAILVLTRDGGHRYIGETFTIERVGPFKKGYPLGDGMCARLDCDYRIRHADGITGAVKDWQLLKLDPPDEPASLTHNEECEVSI